MSDDVMTIEHPATFKPSRKLVKQMETAVALQQTIDAELAPAKAALKEAERRVAALQEEAKVRQRLALESLHRELVEAGFEDDRPRKVTLTEAVVEISKPWTTTAVTRPVDLLEVLLTDYGDLLEKGELVSFRLESLRTHMEKGFLDRYVTPATDWLRRTIKVLPK